MSLLQSSCAPKPARAVAGARSVGSRITGYGDHPTDVPFLRACDTGVLVHELSGEEGPGGLMEGLEYVPASPYLP